jgi:hypothetical protein
MRGGLADEYEVTDKGIHKASELEKKSRRQGARPPALPRTPGAERGRLVAGWARMDDYDKQEAAGAANLTQSRLMARRREVCAASRRWMARACVTVAAHCALQENLSAMRGTKEQWDRLHPRFQSTDAADPEPGRCAARAGRGWAGEP